MTMVLEKPAGFGRGFPLEAVVDNTRGQYRVPVAPYADTKADNRLLKRKPSKYESPLISYTGITLMKLTNAETMDRETLPWLSVLNCRLQKPSPRLPADLAKRQPLCHSRPVSTRRDTRRDDDDNDDINAKASHDVEHVCVANGKTSRSHTFSRQVIDPLTASAEFRISVR